MDDSFPDNNLVGSFNGDYFRQDRMTVLAGRLPRLDSTSGIALNQAMARQFGVGMGGKVTWQFSRLLPSGKSLPARPSSTRATWAGSRSRWRLPPPRCAARRGS